jgi:mRNA interferase RelE/StbE
LKYEILFAPQAIDDLKRLHARERATILAKIEGHLRDEPFRTSRSRIKRLRGINQPQYRLRVGDIRIFYDVVEQNVEILAIIQKSRAEDWLRKYGEME